MKDNGRDETAFNVEKTNDLADIVGSRWRSPIDDTLLVENDLTQPNPLNELMTIILMKKTINDSSYETKNGERLWLTLRENLTLTQ